MVFKFERKSTEKKCEKRKNWRLLWKKIRNNINLCNYWRQRCKTRRQAASKHTYVRVPSCVRTCTLMRTYVWAYAYIRVSSCIRTYRPSRIYVFPRACPRCKKIPHRFLAQFLRRFLPQNPAQKFRRILLYILY